MTEETLEEWVNRNLAIRDAINADAPTMTFKGARWRGDIVWAQCFIDGKCIDAWGFGKSFGQSRYNGPWKALQ
jgi:hypothetical protein